MLPGWEHWTKGSWILQRPSPSFILYIMKNNQASSWTFDKLLTLVSGISYRFNSCLIILFHPFLLCQRNDHWTSLLNSMIWFRWRKSLQILSDLAGFGTAMIGLHQGLIDSLMMPSSSMHLTSSWIGFQWASGNQGTRWTCRNRGEWW